MVESAAAILQRQRQRKFHRRSRNGCFICKKKHIRCDERKPLCTYCLRHGGDCGYPDLDSAITDIRRGSVHSSEDPREDDELCLPLQDAAPRDTFFGSGFDVPRKCRPLFQLFITTKYSYTNPVPRESNSFVSSEPDTRSYRVHRALSNPGFLHGALLMTTLQWAWSTGDEESFSIPYLYHKLQAIRYVNEQLANPGSVVDDGTIAAVAILAIVENALGSIEATASHLCGLAKIKEIQDRNEAPLGLLQRMILMAARCIAGQPVWNILDIGRTDSVHQSMVVSLLRVALRPIYSVFTLGGSNDNDSAEPLSEILAKKSPHPQAGDSNVIAPLRSVDCSRSHFISCHFYLYVILRENTVDSFVLNWFIEQLLADVERTEEDMYKEQYSQSLWFWTVMFGACATTAARATSALEIEQMQSMRNEYLRKIDIASQVLRINTWEGAKAQLRLFAWEDDFNGELELKALWEEACMGR
ncbi:uncharacterized protein BCR38DRAFT_410356 [Pseudomassariella vexata]|uniref:Zn(2)-C6 fungal-type domain-containing protein n=1 Tax=Pseudomassariella vexata TaxID=1141098 RepID=A0A1Y2DW63_9PEZI|nr:uncharacterized protein BCR38DRAFT_410356 [Pseudomassariella vexata]ORY63429.1 hypothetical protein BCR38DRAFT_410356 [Pseudomassariella vexata]